MTKAEICRRESTIWARSGWNTSTDDHGRLTHQSLLSADGKPQLGRRGNAGWRLTYDANGNMVKEAFHGVKGETVIARNGEASYEWTYDEFGRTLEQIARGLDGNLVADSGGVAIIRYEPGVNGETTRATNLDTQRKPTLTRNGIAGYTAEYDRRGNRVSEAYFDTDGMPTLQRGGFAAVKKAYDDRNSPVERTILGLERKAIDLPSFPSQRMEMDSRGNVVHVLNVDRAGRPFRDDDGVASWRATYDKFNRLMAIDYFGPDGTPSMMNDGHAGERYAYNDNGNMTACWYVDIDGKPIVKNDGVFKILKEYRRRRTRAARALCRHRWQAAHGQRGRRRHVLRVTTTSATGSKPYTAMATDSRRRTKKASPAFTPTSIEWDARHFESFSGGTADRPPVTPAAGASAASMTIAATWFDWNVSAPTVRRRPTAQTRRSGCLRSTRAAAKCGCATSIATSGRCSRPTGSPAGTRPSTGWGWN